MQMSNNYNIWFEMTLINLNNLVAHNFYRIQGVPSVLCAKLTARAKDRTHALTIILLGLL